MEQSGVNLIGGYVFFMTDDLIQINAWAGALLAKLAPTQRRQLARAIAMDLSRSQRAPAQRAPDGTPYAPRKARRLREKRGAIRRKKAAVFVKLRTARWLKAQATAEGAEVGFFGRVARLARGGLSEAERNKCEQVHGKVATPRLPRLAAVGTPSVRRAGAR